MIDQGLVDNIQRSGLAQGEAGVAARTAVLQDMGFRMADRAEYVLLASCFLPTMVPEDMRAFGNLLHHYGVDYTLLPREYCCGNLLLRGALKDSTGQEMKQAEAIVAGFVDENIRQMKKIGATKIITFCVSCDAVYRRMPAPVEEVIWFPTLINRLFSWGRLNESIDYYAGCHYFYHRLGVAPDLDSARAVLGRIEGLKVNYLDNRLCCTRRPQLETTLTQIKSDTVVTVCAGCGAYLEPAVAGKAGKVIMLPRLAWAALSGQKLW